MFENTMTMKIKVAFGDDIRRYELPAQISKKVLLDLVAFVKISFNLTRFYLKYQDDEGELITITHPSEIQEALAIALKKFPSFKIFVVNSSVTVEDSSVAAAAAGGGIFVADSSPSVTVADSSVAAGGGGGEGEEKSFIVFVTRQRKKDAAQSYQRFEVPLNASPNDLLKLCEEKWNCGGAVYVVGGQGELCNPHDPLLGYEFYFRSEFTRRSFSIQHMKESHLRLSVAAVAASYGIGGNIKRIGRVPKYHLNVEYHGELPKGFVSDLECVAVIVGVGQDTVKKGKVLNRFSFAAAVGDRDDDLPSDDPEHEAEGSSRASSSHGTFDLEDYVAVKY